MTAGSRLLDIRELTIAFETSDSPVVDNVSVSLETGKVLAIVGESGSGKTLLARSIMGLLPPGAIARSGEIHFVGQDLATLSPQGVRMMRGDQISMVFQEPLVSLNPLVRIDRQLTEAGLERGVMSRPAAYARAIELLERVAISSPEAIMRRFPHELSGGMCQRIMIAAAMMLKPRLLIADEPTTALDCTVQQEVLRVMLEAARVDNTAVLLISHDLGLVAGYADDVLVMKAGRQVEYQPAADLLANPAAAYTRELLAAATVAQSAQAKPGAEHTVCTVEHVSIDYPVRRDWPWQPRTSKRAVADVSLDVRRGETVALVGESGSGKSSVGKAILGLTAFSQGRIRIDGELIAGDKPHINTRAQCIFQNPYAALSPRKTVWQAVAEPLQVGRRLDAETVTARTREMLEDVGLVAQLYQRLPHELSGGQRQRVCIARALINRPRLVVADEPVSALDVTIQAQVLELLGRLQSKYGFGCLFISHDLGVVETVSTRVIVMHNGQVVERGDTADVFANPQHAYTRRLLTAMPVLQFQADLGYRISHRQFSEATR